MRHCVSINRTNTCTTAVTNSGQRGANAVKQVLDGSKEEALRQLTIWKIKLLRTVVTVLPMSLSIRNWTRMHIAEWYSWEPGRDGQRGGGMGGGWWVRSSVTCRSGHNNSIFLQSSVSAEMEKSQQGGWKKIQYCTWKKMIEQTCCKIQVQPKQNQGNTRRSMLAVCVVTSQTWIKCLVLTVKTSISTVLQVKVNGWNRVLLQGSCNCNLIDFWPLQHSTCMLGHTNIKEFCRINYTRGIIVITECSVIFICNCGGKLGFNRIKTGDILIRKEAASIHPIWRSTY